MGNNKISNLTAIVPSKRIDPTQPKLELNIEKQVEIDGVCMGVLSDGTPFMTQRGLAIICGVENAHIGTIDTQWDEFPPKPRIAAIKKILEAHSLAIPVKPSLKVMQGGRLVYAYSDSVCLAVLEYYSFEAGTNIQDQAKKNFRALAGKSLRDFIYTKVGYTPDGNREARWKQFHDRVSINYNSVPAGYFSVFKAIAGLIVDFIEQGLPVDSKFVPDISVGKSWSRHWEEKALVGIHGERIKYDHNYPEYFPQAMSNPQDCWCYPESALGDFSKWLRENYIRDGKLAKYINSKVAASELPRAYATAVIEAYKAAGA